jgi:hypothetical protein
MQSPVEKAHFSDTLDLYFARAVIANRHSAECSEMRRRGGGYSTFVRHNLQFSCVVQPLNLGSITFPKIRVLKLITQFHF